MNFTFNEDQLAFREAISRFLMTEAAPEMLRDIWETDTGRSPDLRGKLAEQGMTALSVPEARGGLGMDDIARSLMTQELGYYAIPDSLADTAYVAAGMLAGLPQGEARDARLAQIAEGSIRVAVGHPVNQRPMRSWPTCCCWRITMKSTPCVAIRSSCRPMPVSMPRAACTA